MLQLACLLQASLSTIGWRHINKFSLQDKSRQRQRQDSVCVRQEYFFYLWCFDWIIAKLQALFSALHKVLKTSACVTKNSKKAGDSSRYAGNREKGLKNLETPAKCGIVDGYAMWWWQWYFSLGKEIVVVVLVFHGYLYNKQNITCPLVDTNLIFSCSSQ